MSTNQPHGIPEHQTCLHAGQEPTWERHRAVLIRDADEGGAQLSAAIAAAMAKIDHLTAQRDRLFQDLQSAHILCVRAAIGTGAMKHGEATGDGGEVPTIEKMVEAIVAQLGKSKATIARLTAERDRLRAALEFYADPETYQADADGNDGLESDTSEIGSIIYPGKLAREALAGIGGGE